MNKPISVIIKDTKIKLANICNDSGLPPVILDLIIQGIYSEIHSFANKQIKEDEEAYSRMIDDDKNGDSNV